MKSLTREFLYTQHVVLKKSAETISKELGTYSPSGVDYWIGKYSLRSGRPKLTKLIDQEGMRFGKLTVISRGITHPRYTFWRCKCDCGVTKDINLSSLRSGRTTSCGCWNGGTPFGGFGEISGSYWHRLIKSAGARKHEFSISISYAWGVFLKQERKCSLTGEILVFCRNFSNKKEYAKQTASLDRIDPSIGYVEGNVQWVNKHVNKIRNNLSVKDFVNLCKRVVKYCG